MQLLKRLIPVVVFAVVLIGVVYFISPPSDWQSASFLQILIFFLPLLLLAISLVNLLINNLMRSAVLGLGLMFLVILQSIGELNPITFAITLVLTAILAIYFKGSQLPRRLRRSKISKL